MNINQNINKLLFVLKRKGQLYKINSFQFYSEKTDKYCTKYQILKKEQVEVYNIKKNGYETVEKYRMKKECYSKVDVMKYLMEEYKGMG